MSSEVAYAILEPYFEATREAYLAFAQGLPLPTSALKKVRMECREEMHDTPRHFAGASEDGSLIAVAPQMVDLPEDTVAAIFAHEFGHVLDFLNPAYFSCDTEEQILLRVPLAGSREDKSRIAQMRQWRSRDEHTVELTADLIAEQVIGVRIGYSGPCMLQGFGRGVSRPRDLR
jgi:hypothetical protein